MGHRRSIAVADPGDPDTPDPAAKLAASRPLDPLCRSAHRLKLHLDIRVAVTVPLDLGSCNSAPDQAPVVFPVSHHLADQAWGEGLDPFLVKGKAEFSRRHLRSLIMIACRAVGRPSLDGGAAVTQMQQRRSSADRVDEI